MLLLLLSLAGSAQAEPLTQAQVKAMSPVDWNDHWVGIHDEAVIELYRMQLRIYTSTDSGPLVWEPVAARLKALQVEAQASADWPKEEGLREAVILDLGRIIDVLEQTLPKVAALTAQPHPRDSHHQQAGALWQAMERRDQSAQEAVEIVQADFAASHNLVLRMAGALPEPPAFKGSFPGPASPLPPTIQANFAVGHYNEIVESSNQTLECWARAVRAEGDQVLPVLAEQAPLVQAELDKLQWLPGWLGDEGPRDAAIYVASEMLDMMNGLILEIAALERRAQVFARARKQYNELASEQRRRTNHVNREMRQAERSYVARWHIEDMQDYHQELEDWAFRQQLRPTQ